MQEHPLSQLEGQELLTVTSQIAFFNELYHESPDQFHFLMAQSRLLEFQPSEIVLNKSDTDPVFYSLIRGSVDVFPGVKPEPFAISQLSSGQLFGVMATLNDEARSATLAASNPAGAKVLVTDFSAAGELNDFSSIALSTKLGLYRHVVNNTRWKLQVYKNSTNDPTLAQELSVFSLYQGKKGTFEELLFLAGQCQNLASLMDCWNDVAEPSIAIVQRDPTSAIDKVFSLFRKAKAG